MTSPGADLNLVLSGLPAAGKTTFLAALWQVFETDAFESALSLDSYAGEQRYIVELNRAWANCEPLERTPLQTPGLLRVSLRDAQGRTIELVVPDLSGEVFRDHWTDRRWDPKFDQRVQTADGIVLMINTLTKEPLLISEVQAAEAALDGLVDDSDNARPGSADQGEVEAAEATGGSTNVPRKWDPRKCPPQVQLVEHLQFVAYRREQRPIPVVAVLSAWDQVMAVDNEIAPEEWLGKRLPLLDQYLRANTDQFPSTAFGISAQGGDLEEDRERLLVLRPVERLWVTGGGEHDLTLPLAWLAEAAGV